MNNYTKEYEIFFSEGIQKVMKEIIFITPIPLISYWT